MEIITQYTSWKDGVTENIKGNLTTKKILGIEDLTEKDRNRKKKQKGETEAEKIDSVIELDRKEMIKKIKGHYESISGEIDKIFKHKNTAIVELTDQILIAGMKRSLLKKSPYTKTDKSTENAHTKDIDCIAFEALISFCNKHYNKKKKDCLIMCVSDKDYLSSDGKLHGDMKGDIKMEHKCYVNLQEMMNKEFKVKIDIEKLKKQKEISSKELTLSPKTGTVEGYSGVISSDLSSNF